MNLSEIWLVEIWLVDLCAHAICYDMVVISFSFTVAPLFLEIFIFSFM